MLFSNFNKIIRITIIIKQSKLRNFATKLFNLGYYLALFKKKESAKSMIIPPIENSNPIIDISIYFFFFKSKREKIFLKIKLTGLGFLSSTK